MFFTWIRNNRQPETFLAGICQNQSVYCSAQNALSAPTARLPGFSPVKNRCFIWGHPAFAACFGAASCG
jgi:hypothetical protein